MKKASLFNMRLFIAIPLPKYLRKGLEEYIQHYPYTQGLRWTAPQNLHITVQFLGEVDERHIEEIERRLVGYITDPIVKVELESYPIKLLGEVNVPGLYEAQSNSPTLFEAIALAQGLSNYANRKEVQLIRTSGEQVNVVYFDITDPDVIESEYYFMHPGDVLVFNPVKAKRFEDRTTTYALSAVSSLVVILNILISR